MSSFHYFKPLVRLTFLYYVIWGVCGKALAVGVLQGMASVGRAGGGKVVF